MTRYRFDRTVERHGKVVIGGSPLKLFRLTAGGVAVVDAIERGEAVEPSILVDRLLDAGAIHPVHDTGGPHRYTASDVTVVVPVHGELGRRPGRRRRRGRRVTVARRSARRSAWTSTSGRPAREWRGWQR